MDSRPEFQFLDFTTHERTPGAATPSKNEALRPLNRGPGQDCEDRANDLRALAVLLIVTALATYGGIAWGMGWL